MERKSYSHRTVFVGFALSLVLALGAAFYIYQRYVKYTPVALRHVPESALFVTRLSVEQAVVFEPFRRHILSVFETGRGPGETREKHLERKTTLELTVDSRELVFAEMPQNQWLLVLAGLFRTTGVVDGVGRMLTEEKVPFESKGDVLVHEGGISFGVSPDGCLLLASSQAVLSSAQAQQQRPPRYAELDAPGLALSVTSRNPTPPEGRDKGHKRLPVPVFGSLLVEAGDPFLVRGLVETPPGLNGYGKRALFRADSTNKDLLVLLAYLRADAIAKDQVEVSGRLSRPEFEQAVVELGARIHSALIPGGPEANEKAKERPAELRGKAGAGKSTEGTSQKVKPPLEVKPQRKTERKSD